MNFGDGVGAFLVRGPYWQLDVGLCDVDVFLHWNSAAEDGAGVGLKLNLQGGTGFYSEEKKLIFLLPLIVQAHHLLPDMPIFWANDNSPLSLYKSYTWMHEDTIKWLAETGAHYPSALRPQIQPRIEALRTWQPGRRQPPTPPQPNRWQEKRTDRRDDVEAQAPAPSKPQLSIYLQGKW